MSRLFRPGDSGRNGVETIAEGREVGFCPCLTGEAAVGDEDQVAKVRGARTVECAVWVIEGDVSA